MTPFDLLIQALACWYVAYALTSTHGPGGVFLWIRENVWHGRRGVDTGTKFDSNTGTALVSPPSLKNGLLDCMACTSVWVALLLLLVPDGVIVHALAVAGAALLAHGYSGWRFGGG